MKTSFHASLFFALLLAPLAALRAADAPAKPAGGKPNIIVILSDDLGWKDVGHAGSTFYRTSNIDRLARGGMQFSQAYSAACVCSPSRGAIYSGKNPARTALTTVFRTLHPGVLRERSGHLRKQMVV